MKLAKYAIYVNQSFTNFLKQNCQESLDLIINSHIKVNVNTVYSNLNFDDLVDIFVELPYY